MADVKQAEAGLPTVTEQAVSIAHHAHLRHHNQNSRECAICDDLRAAIQSALDERGRSEYERGRSDEQDSREEITEARNRAGR